MLLRKFIDYIAILAAGGSAGWIFYYLNTSYGSSSFIVLIFLCGLVTLAVFFFYILKNPPACLPLIIGLSFLVFYEPAPFDVLMILALLALVINLITSSDKILRISAVEAALLVFVLSNISNVIVSHDMSQGIRHFSITLFMAVIFLFFSKLTNSIKILDYQLQLFLVPCIITSLALILGYLVSNQGVELGALSDIIVEEGRPRAFFKDSNVAGPFLILGSAYSFANVLNRSWKRKRIYLLLFFLFCTGIYFTYSRGALLALTFIAIVIITLNFNLKHFIKLLLIIVLTTLPLLAFVDEPDRNDSLSDRLLDFRFGVRDRIKRIENGLKVFKENPFFGTGMRLPFGKAPHDSYFLLLTQQGLIGFLSFWIPIIYIICSLLFIQNQPDNVSDKIIRTTLAATLMAHMVLGLVIYFLHWRHFWFITGLSIGYLQTIKSAESAEK